MTTKQTSIIATIPDGSLNAVKDSLMQCGVYGTDWRLMELAGTRGSDRAQYVVSTRYIQTAREALRKHSIVFRERL